MASVNQNKPAVIVASQARIASAHVSGTPCRVIGVTETGALFVKAFANEDLLNAWLISGAAAGITVERVVPSAAGSF
jgi:hypothetical protein